MTRVVVQRGAAASNTSHNRSSTTPPSSTTSSQSSSQASVQPSHSSPSGTHAEEEIVLDTKDAEPVNYYGGDSDSLVAELINKAGALNGSHDSRAFEREQVYGHGEISEDASTSSSIIRETDGRKERDGAAQASLSYVQRQEVGRDSSEAVESGCLQEAQGAREHGEDTRIFNFPTKNDRDGGPSCDTGGPSSDWKQDCHWHPPQALPQSSSPQHPSSSSWHTSAMPWLGSSVPSSSIPCSSPSHSVHDMAPLVGSDHARPNFCSNSADLVGCSYNSTSPASQPLPSSSRRNTWVGSSVPTTSRGALSRRSVRACKPSRISPNSSRPSSPISYGEGDGYNSADEQTPWSGSAGYENNGERERQFEVDIRRAKGLEVRRMAEDGNCLFRAVTDQIYGDAEMYDETRQMCIDYMEKERDHFSQFVTESFTAYCKRKRRDKTNVDREQVKAALKAQQDQQIDKALLAEGRFYSDLELTEQEIQRMVMEASRAEFFEEESHRHVAPWCEETSTSAGAEPSSSGTTGSPKSAVRSMSLAATSTTCTDSSGLTSNVRMLLSMGFSYLQVMEASSIFGDDVNNMLCYLLETEGTPGEGENMYRMKGKAAER